MGGIYGSSAFLSVFIALAVLFTAFTFYFASYVGRSSKAFLKSKIFLNADPLLKAFYQFFIGTAFSYFFFLVYFLDTDQALLFIIGEVTLGLSLIGFAYLALPLFLKK